MAAEPRVAAEAQGILPDVELTERARLERAIADAQRTLFDLATETAKREAEASDAEEEAKVMKTYLDNVALGVRRIESRPERRGLVDQATDLLGAFLEPPPAARRPG